MNLMSSKLLLEAMKNPEISRNLKDGHSINVNVMYIKVNLQTERLK